MSKGLEKPTLVEGGCVFFSDEDGRFELQFMSWFTGPVFCGSLRF